MTKKVLLTGRPGCGKTTLIKHLAKKLALTAGGFYTEEIRERRERVGFKIITLEGKDSLLAHIGFKTPERVGKYGLDLSGLEAVGVEAIRTAVRARRLIVIDEIGPMEIRSAAFYDAVNEAFGPVRRFLPRSLRDVFCSPTRSRIART
jgi:nucleoside-triphosphatase